MSKIPFSVKQSTTFNPIHSCVYLATDMTTTLENARIGAGNGSGTFNIIYQSPSFDMINLNTGIWTIKKKGLYKIDLNLEFEADELSAFLRINNIEYANLTEAILTHSGQEHFHHLSSSVYAFLEQEDTLYFTITAQSSGQDNFLISSGNNPYKSWFSVSLAE